MSTMSLESPVDGERMRSWEIYIRSGMLSLKETMGKEQDDGDDDHGQSKYRIARTLALLNVRPLVSLMRSFISCNIRCHGMSFDPSISFVILVPDITVFDNSSTTEHIRDISLTLIPKGHCGN